MNIQFYSFLSVTLVFIAGCASTPRSQVSPYSAEELLNWACKPGQKVSSAKGRVLARVNSEEYSGQFQAQVSATSSGVFDFEVTDPLGGTRARVRGVDGVFDVTDFSGKAPVTQRHVSSWGGIPLRWANDLFLGRIPCPNAQAAAKKVKLERIDEQTLVATVLGSENASEKFVFRFSVWNQKPWPASLRWSRSGTREASVEFEFESPEKETGSPERWSVRSGQGQVKVKWRARDLSSH